MLQRIPGWRSRLDAVIDECRYTAFDWQKFNCAHLAQRAVYAITGERLGQSILARARSERTAASAIKRAGSADLADLLATMLPEIHPSQASVGDISAVETDGPIGYSLGVVAGERIFVLGQDFDGLGTVDLLDASRSFKVG